MSRLLCCFVVLAFLLFTSRGIVVVESKQNSAPGAVNDNGLMPGDTTMNATALKNWILVQKSVDVQMENRMATLFFDCGRCRVYVHSGYALLYLAVDNVAAAATVTVKVHPCTRTGSSVCVSEKRLFPVAPEFITAIAAVVPSSVFIVANTTAVGTANSDRTARLTTHHDEL